MQVQRPSVRWKSVEVALQLGIAEFVAFLKPSVGVRVLLDCVVGEMDVRIRHFVEVEEVAGSPHVSFLIPVSLSLVVMVSDHHIGSDVKLSAVVKQRSDQVLLDDDRAFFLLLDALAHTLTDVLQLVCAFYPVASVAELPWFEDPIVWLFLLFLLVEVRGHSVVLWVEQAVIDDEGKRHH